MDNFVKIIKEETPEATGAWLLENASNITGKMFEPGNSSGLLHLKPLHVFLLRAVTPVEVFTDPKNKSEFKLVTEDPESIADFTFQISDYLFAQKVPDEIRPQIVTLMQLAYRKDIRPYDLRVTRM